MTRRSMHKGAGNRSVSQRSYRANHVSHRARDIKSSLFTFSDPIHFYSLTSTRLLLLRSLLAIATPHSFIMRSLTILALVLPAVLAMPLEVTTHHQYVRACIIHQSTLLIRLARLASRLRPVSSQTSLIQTLGTPSCFLADENSAPLPGYLSALSPNS